MLQHAALLSNSSAPHGILSLQMTYSANDARVILSSWSQAETRHAAVSLYWDMGFAIAYGWFLSALTRYCFRGRSRFALVTAWVPIFAAIADLAENLFHLMLLGAHNGAESVDGGLVFSRLCLRLNEVDPARQLGCSVPIGLGRHDLESRTSEVRLMQ